MSGTIPSEIGLMTKLESVQLQNTQMTGTLPEELYQNPSLLSLDVSGSQFTGTISTLIGLLSNLAWFLIAETNFTGTIPEEMGALSNMYKIALNGNNLANDAVPDSLCELRNPGEALLRAWQLSADCQPDLVTGTPAMECPRTCCTHCCDSSSKICTET